MKIFKESCLGKSVHSVTQCSGSFHGEIFVLFCIGGRYYLHYTGVTTPIILIFFYSIESFTHAHQDEISTVFLHFITCDFRPLEDLLCENTICGA